MLQLSRTFDSIPTLKEIYDFFETIPKNNWTTGNYFIPTFNEELPYRCCAAGFLNLASSPNPQLMTNSVGAWDYKYGEQVEPLGDLLNKISCTFCLKREDCIEESITNITQVNDKQSKAFPQKTPKLRVLAFIQQMIDDNIVLKEESNEKETH